MAIQNTSDIKFQIELDENKIPERLSWTAPEGGIIDEEAKAIMLSIWNSTKKKHYGLTYGLKTCLLMK